MAHEVGTFDLVYHACYQRTRETVVLALETMGQAQAPSVCESVILRERDAGYST